MWRPRARRLFLLRHRWRLGKCGGIPCSSRPSYVGMSNSSSKASSTEYMMTVVSCLTARTAHEPSDRVAWIFLPGSSHLGSNVTVASRSACCEFCHLVCWFLCVCHLQCEVSPRFQPLSCVSQLFTALAVLSVCVFFFLSSREVRVVTA